MDFPFLFLLLLFLLLLLVLLLLCSIVVALFFFFSLLSSSFYLSTSPSPFHLPRLRHQPPTTSSRRSRPQIDHGYEGAATGIKRDPREAAAAATAAGTSEKPRMSDDAQRVLDRSLDQIDGALLRRAQSDIEIVVVIFDRKLDCRAFLPARNTWIVRYFDLDYL